MRTRWVNVSRRNPCPICQRKMGCSVSVDGSMAFCWRVSDGAKKEGRAGGWLHQLGEAVRIPIRYIKPEPPTPRPPCTALLAKWAKETDTAKLMVFAAKLGVDAIALRMLCCAWSAEHRAWAFPMRNGNGVTVGVRLRTEQGDKFAVKGSNQGLFYPLTRLTGTLYIVEGPTDAAAGLTIGLNAVGRPSCRGCEDSVVRLVERFKPPGIVIVADNDEPGQDGAALLQLRLPGAVIWTPPAKDLREFVKLGGTRQLIETMTKDLGI